MLPSKRLGPVAHPGSLIYNPSRIICYYLPRLPASPSREGTSVDPSSPLLSTMTAPFFVQNSVSQVSLPSGDHHPKLKSKVSIPSIVNTVRATGSLHQNRPAHLKNYTKAYGPCTLFLNADQEASSGLPIFSNGAVVSGSLEISEISKVLKSIRIIVSVPTGAPAFRGTVTDLFSR